MKTLACPDFGGVAFLEGAALNNLGTTLRQVGRFDEATTAIQLDLNICRDLGDRHGEGQ